MRAAKAAGRKIENKAERAAPYIKAIENSNDAAKAALLAGLADIGGTDALKAAGNFAMSGNAVVSSAAIDALAHWREAGAMDIVLSLAASAQDSARRVALLNAFASLMAKPSEESLDSKLAQCQKALDIGLDAQGKRAILKAVSEIMDERALEIIEKLGEDPALAEDARRATPAIKQKLLDKPALSASHGEGLVGNAIDGNPGTRWSTNAEQVPGMWLMIDLRMRSDISSIELDTTASPDDYPRGYEVFIANSPENMGQPVASGKGEGPNTRIVFDKPIHGRYIKIAQTGLVKGLWWSIHELRINHNPGFPEVPPPVTKLNDLAKTGGFVTQWNVAGPYTKGELDGGKLFDVPFGPEMDPRLAMWQLLDAKALSDCVVYFDSLFGGNNRVAYLVANIVADKACDAELGIGSDDGVKIWLNNEAVHSKNEGRPVKKDQDKVQVHFKEGSNILLVKVTNNGANWGCCMRVTPK